jgi:uncharacterized protein (DUF2141 family)
MRSLYLALLLALSCRASDSVSLQVEIQDDRQSNCQVYIAVYRDARTWLGDKPFRFEKTQMKSGLGIVEVANLPPGKYAILAYCDKNANGKLDETLLGVPKEPYGFSNGKPGKYELSFAEATIDVPANETRSRQRIALVLP